MTSLGGEEIVYPNKEIGQSNISNYRPSPSSLTLTLIANPNSNPKQKPN